MLHSMKCLINLHKKCIVIEKCIDAKTAIQTIDCNRIINSYASEKFTKSFCSYCIKSVYARAKRTMAMKEVFISL